MYVRGTESTPPLRLSAPAYPGLLEGCLGETGECQGGPDGFQDCSVFIFNCHAAPPHPPQESSLPQTSGREQEGEHGFSPS